MRIKKYILENGLRTLGLVIVLAYGLCYICARFKLLGICQMDNDSLTAGLLLILIGNGAHYKAKTPDQSINTGIVFLCGIIGLLLVEALRPFLSIVDVVPYPGFAGSTLGLVFGLVLNKLRPPYAEAKGRWRVVMLFVLTQMDFEKAFKREKKGAQTVSPNPHPPSAQGAGCR